MTDEADANGKEATPESDAITAVTTEELTRLRKLAGERDQYLDLVLRTRAEFENYQKRSQRDRELERKYSFGTSPSICCRSSTISTARCKPASKRAKPVRSCKASPW